MEGKGDFRAAFEVDNYENFVQVHRFSRKLAGTYPYTISMMNGPILPW
jgi:hypothetical protein